MERNLMVAGFGGQGVMTLGKFLAEAACDSTDKNVTFFPSYGAEQRGGTANCYVVISDDDIGAPLGDRMDGFRRGVEETGMTCAGEFILPRRTAPIQPFDSDPARSAEPEYQSAIGEVLDRLDPLPESFVCTEFAIARSLYAAARARGLEVGRDFKACCIDEDYLAMGGFRFTHMRQDEIAIADKAVEVLLGLLDGSCAGRSDFRVPALFRMGATT